MKDCKLKDPTKCDYSLFIEEPDGTCYVLCWPEYYALQPPNISDFLMMSKEESDNEVKRYAKERADLINGLKETQCPYPCKEWK